MKKELQVKLQELNRIRTLKYVVHKEKEKYYLCRLEFTEILNLNIHTIFVATSQKDIEIHLDNCISDVYYFDIWNKIEHLKHDKEFMKNEEFEEEKANLENKIIKCCYLSDNDIKVLIDSLC